MADPGYVKLRADLQGEGVYDLASGWSLAGRDVAKFPTDSGEAYFVRRAILQGKLVTATKQEYDDSRPPVVVDPGDGTGGPATPTGPAGGALGGTYPDPTVPGLASKAEIVNTDGDPGKTIYVGTIDPSIDYDLEPGDVWLGGV